MDGGRCDQEQLSRFESMGKKRALILCIDSSAAVWSGVANQLLRPVFATVSGLPCLFVFSLTCVVVVPIDYFFFYFIDLQLCEGLVRIWLLQFICTNLGLSAAVQVVVLSALPIFSYTNVLLQRTPRVQLRRIWRHHELGRFGWCHRIFRGRGMVVYVVVHSPGR